MSSIPTSSRPVAVAALADAVVVFAFASVGRSSHAETVDLVGVLTTAWPFVAALSAGWLVVRAWQSPQSVLRTGLGVWVITVVGGLLLRWASGQSNALGFVIVTAVVLGFGLLGWRACARLVARRRAHSRSGTPGTSANGI